MFYELIAALAAGISAAAVVMLLRWLVPALPGWLVPVAAGAGMFAMAVLSEYAWFSRNEAVLAEGVVVAERFEERMGWRPWTLLAPITTRFIALDQGRALRRGDQVMVDHLLYARWKRPIRLTAVYDCAQGLRADITESVRISEAGTLEGALWREVAADNPTLRRACDGES